MHKDDAMRIAHTAENMSLDQLMAAYIDFHHHVENTPVMELSWFNKDGSLNEELGAYAHNRSLHGAIGLATEAAEILDAHKKEIFGKRRPLSKGNMREECGDVLFYLVLVMDAHGITMRDIVSDNVVKLANRYIEKFDV
jgi:NTP pyrophosphatase (non-canonical NTP hydrolase)